MRNVLFIAPTSREHRVLPQIAAELDINLIWDDFAGDYFDDFLQQDAVKENTLDIVALIEETIDKHSKTKLDGVTSAVGYPGMSAVAVIAQRLGLPGPHPSVIMRCEHKYYSRLAQQSIVPEATPRFHLVRPNDESSLAQVTEFPSFLKPIKSCMSMNAFAIESAKELREKAPSAVMPERFTEPFDQMCKAYTNLELSCRDLLVEDRLKGRQVSLEGYVQNGKPVVMGIVDGEMLPGTLSFTRWLYPSRLPKRALDRMVEVAERFFAGIGYDNAMFNMELFWDESQDKVSIIEVNPKIASQFPDLFEKVDGVNGYKILLQIAVGDKAEFKRGSGNFKLAASCVLRSMEDRKVLRKPTQEDINQVVRKYPDALINVIATEGKNLSEQSQDTSTFRYGLINIGANSIDELESKNKECADMLRYEFGPPDTQQASALR